MKYVKQQFSVMENSQQRMTIPDFRGRNEVNPVIVLAFYLKAVFRLDPGKTQAERGGLIGLRRQGLKFWKTDTVREYRLRYQKKRSYTELQKCAEKFP